MKFFKTIFFCISLFFTTLLIQLMRLKQKELVEFFVSRVSTNLQYDLKIKILFNYLKH